ncbi:MAG: right-handed parallel beta-helix repeat-containing protein [Treponemataceae bacterium]|nr:right-handed parallel beta-helix repeat-containing protein [Treponemataceae bacterium]
MTLKFYIEKFNLIKEKKDIKHSPKLPFTLFHPLNVIRSLSLSIVCLLLFLSCSNLFEPPKKAEVSPVQGRNVTIRGSFSEYQPSMNGAYPDTLVYNDRESDQQTHMASPGALTGQSQYFIRATAVGQRERTGTVNSENKTFEINLTIGYSWTIEVELQTQEEGEDAPTTKLTGTYTYSHALSAADINPATPVSITLEPTTTGTGKIDLNIQANETLYDNIEITGAWEGATVADGYINEDNIQSGVYEIQLNFIKTDIIVYSCDQQINVFDNMTTNKWINNGNVSESLILTQEMIEEYARTNLYVASATNNPAGNDTTGEGTSLRPFATIGKALQVLEIQNQVIGPDDGSEPEYTIHLLSDILLSDINENTTISSDIQAARITIKGYDGNKKIEAVAGQNTSASILTINTAIPVTLDNLTLNNNHNPAGTSGGGIYIGSPADSQQDTPVQADVTLYNCTIQSCSSAYPGGGIYVAQGSAATLTYCNIEDNETTSSEGGGGIYAEGSVTLNNCQVTGNSADIGGNGGGIYAGGEVTLNNCWVTGNSADDGNGAGIYNNGTLNIQGTINVTGNTKGTGDNAKSNNLYLPSDKIITVTEALDADSRIGVTTSAAPSLGTPLVFTNSLTELNPDIDVDTVFTSDEGYAVAPGTEDNAGKATLATSGGGIGTSFDYTVTLSSTNTTIAPSSVLTISADVTNNTNNDEVVTVSAEDITWAFTLLCYGDPVPLTGEDDEVVNGIIPASNIVAEAGIARVIIPSTASVYSDMDYTLHVSASFHGIAYDTNISLTGDVAPEPPSSSYTVVDNPPNAVSVSGATYVKFGLWPQTIKYENVTVNENIAISVGGFIYYRGDDSEWYVKAAENGNTYSSSDHTYSDRTTVGQGGSSYKYFMVEPILWRVVNDKPETGKKTLIAEKALTAIQYYDDKENRDDIKAFSYDHSRIRAFLNGIEYNKQGTTSYEFDGKGFLQTAFTSDEQALIQVTPVDNTNNVDEAYRRPGTNDKVFLLSNSELGFSDDSPSPYGFTSGTSDASNKKRIRPLSDLAIANGTFVTKVTESGIEIRRGNWWTRTPGQNSNANAKIVDAGGTIGNGTVNVFYGVVPVLVLNNE